MRTLPQTISRIQRPGEFEKQFVSYLQAAGANIDQSKSIAGVTYYHFKDVSGVQNATFFNGNIASQEQTNLNNFVRPESEHFLISAIRVSYSLAAFVAGTPLQWVNGVTGTGAIENSYITISNNNVVELKNYPLSEALATLTTVDDGLIVLEQPILWKGQTELKIELHNPVAAFPASNSLRLALVGIGLV